MSHDQIEIEIFINYQLHLKIKFTFRKDLNRQQICCWQKVVDYDELKDVDRGMVRQFNKSWSVKSELILPLLILQLKTGVRMPLTSSVKELEAILQKLIKFEPG